jgi:peptidoglycan-N-acetylglucosamine deacetylase
MERGTSMTSPWHRGAAAVATLTFDVDAETPILAQGRRYADHMMTMSHQSYGPDVGVPRILDMLDDLNVPATFFVPGWVAEHRPGLAASIVERGHEVAHHSYSHRSPVTLTAAEERADFERALDVFAAQRIEIRGHRPYRLATESAPIVELPVHWSLDDWEQYAYLPEPHIGSVIESPIKAAEMWRTELDGMRRYRCLFNLCVHPFLSGRPGRIVALRGLIEYALGLGDVHFARCRDA